MDSGRELTVWVAELSQGGGSTLLVEVSDTGCRIPDDMIEQIFNPLVTTKARGTGLGLTISRAIADAHKVMLRARNHPGRPGCTFNIEFPVPAAKPAGVKTVLLVAENETVEAKLLKALTDYSIFPARTDEEALVDLIVNYAAHPARDLDGFIAKARQLRPTSA